MLKNFLTTFFSLLFFHLGLPYPHVNEVSLWVHTFLNYIQIFPLEVID